MAIKSVRYSTRDFPDVGFQQTELSNFEHTFKLVLGNNCRKFSNLKFLKHNENVYNN